MYNRQKGGYVSIAKCHNLCNEPDKTYSGSRKVPPIFCIIFKMG